MKNINFSKKFIQYMLLTLALLLVSCKEAKVELVENNPWKIMQQILDSVAEPNFPDKTFNILDFGAVADGVTNNTVAFQNAIKKCSESGGGKVIVPKGKYLTGAIHLDNNVNLHLEEESEILFSTNPLDYPIVHTSFEGIELMNYSPLIYAYKKKNIAVTGKGILNGQASNENWWVWKGHEVYGWKKRDPSQLNENVLPRLAKMSEDNVDVSERIFGEGYYLRPSFLQPFDCENVLIKDVKIINAPFWVLHPIKCTNVIIDGVTVESHGPNNDGCDPEYSKNVIIINCTFNTGDDCIAIKAGRDAEGRRVAIKSENIVIQNCKMIDGHGGVVIGSEASAGVRNVFVDNCVMDSPNLDRAIRIKTNSKRGGVIENIYVRNLVVGEVKEAVLRINMFYDYYGNQTGDFMPVVQNIHLENIKVKYGGKYGILAKGYKESTIKNVTFKNVVIEKVDSLYSLENVENLKFENTYINGILMKNLNN
ncbi:MAG TPA: glycoside hydrolase family 28 protein [Lutibacter sp.]|nr:glycoside hydrolase family 28 protein [Lutibacter sp.]